MPAFATQSLPPPSTKQGRTRLDNAGCETVENFSKKLVVLRESDVAERLGLSVEAVINLADEGQIAHRKVLSTNSYYFREEAVSAWYDSLLQESEPKIISDTAETSSCLPLTSANTSASSTITVQEDAHEISTPLESEPEKVKELLHPDIASGVDKSVMLKQQRTVLSKLERYFTSNRKQQSNIRKEWDINKETNQNLGCLVTKFEANVALVSTSDPSEGYRLDLRSAHSLRPIFEKCKSGLRIRLNSMNAIGARIEANEYIRSLVEQSGIKSKIEESVIYSSIEFALKSAKRLKAIGKSSGKQIEVKAGKLAVWHYILAGLDLSCVNEDFIWDLIEALCQQNIANSTINKYLIELRGILEGLIAKGLITRSIKIPTLGTKTRDLIEMDLKTFEIFKRHYAKNETERNMLDTAYLTGARKSNVLEDFSVDNLKLSDEQDGITLRTASMIWLDAYSCKGKRRMDILLQREARAAIEKQIAYRQKNGITHPNLFALDNQGTIIKINRTRWKNALQKANVDPEFTFHHFRHNRAYQVLMNGGTFEEVRQLLGLSSTKMVEVVYGHVQITDGAVKSGSISYS